MDKSILQKNFSSLATTQSQLAKTIGMPEITQRYISYIVNGQKSLSVERIREIEKNLVIPTGWLDRYLFDYKTLIKIRKYRNLERESQQVFDELSLYMISLEKSNEKN